MSKKIYVVTMENEEMDVMEIGYASNQQIADKMIEKASATDGFEDNTYNSYQATVDYLEINGKPVCFKEEVLSKPLSMKQMVLATSDDNTYIQGNIVVELNEIIGTNLEEFLDLLSERLAGTTLLMDVDYKIVDTLDERIMVLRVSGNVSEILQVDFDMHYELQTAIIKAGKDALTDFFGIISELHGDNDITKKMFTDAMIEMTEEDKLRFYRKYCG